MANRNNATVWEANPHTIAKIAILRNYLYAYLQILGGKRPNETILYIDGFAGPGEYTNYAEGSPLAALRAAIKARSTADQSASWIAGPIHLAFVEQSKRRYAHLLDLMSRNSQHPLIESGDIRIHTYYGTFVENLPSIRRDIPEPFERRDPLFAFLDPFGATGVPFSSAKELLQSPSSDLLLNFDGDGITRILRANQPNAKEQLDDIFGGDYWRKRVEGISGFSQQYRELLNVYRERLYKLPSVRYTFPFEMRTTNTTLNYWLVFASKHPLGIEKMKKAMISLDQTGTYCFCDAVARSGQTRFDFGEHDVKNYSPRLLEQFAGQKLLHNPYNLPRDFALNETPFLNPKKMLVHLEKEGKLKVESTDPKRRRGTFKEDKLKSLHFAPFDGDN